MTTLYLCKSARPTAWNRLLRASEPWLVLTTILSMYGILSACISMTDPELVKVIVTVEGDDVRLAAGPVDLKVQVCGDGTTHSFDQEAWFEDRGNGKYDSDVAVELDESIELPITIQVTADTFTPLIADAQLTTLSYDKKLALTLSPAEVLIDDNARRDEDDDLPGMVGHRHGDDEGIVLAWRNAPIGVEMLEIKKLPDPEELVLAGSLGSVRPLPEVERRVRRVRIASREGHYALAWLTEASPYLRRYSETDEGMTKWRPPVESAELGASDIRVTWMGDQVVTAVLAGEDVQVYRHEPGSDALLTITNTAELLDISPGRNDSLIITRKKVSGRWLVERYDLESGSRLFLLEPDEGDIVATAVAHDRVLLARRSGSELRVQSLDSDTLEPLGAAVPVTTSLEAGDFESISLSECIVIWTERRNDGSRWVDLRYRFIDTHDTEVNLGDPHLVNTVVDRRSSFAPVSHCTPDSDMRVVAFLSADDLDLLDNTSNLHLRILMENNR